MRFINKKVFISGASRGIGREIARSFIAEGAIVIGSSKKFTDKPSFCGEWFYGDYSKIEDIQSCADFISVHRPDILINCAGINTNAPFLNVDIDIFQAIQRVNVCAPLMFCQAAVPSMIENGWGRIVNVASIWGKISMAGRAAYSASKFALDGLTISLAAEHAKNGILANCISPGFIDTELTRSTLDDAEIISLTSKAPIGRLGSVEEVSKFVLWLSSAENTFITGQNIAIDGGFTRV